MMMPGKIRPLTLCLIKYQDKILVGQGFDSKKNEAFYRPLGGGIDFGETGEEALRREFHEELAADLENVKYITTLENIYTYNGDAGHEIVLVYSGDIVQKDIYQKDNLKILDKSEAGRAVWEKVADFKEKKLILYPEEILKYI